MSRSLEIEAFVSGSLREKGALGSADGILLSRFLKERDEEAFETLILRHGREVLSLCRRRLGNSQDADDAFQATFIVLIQHADEIRRTDNIGGWLLGVARRVAGRAAIRADQRRKREGIALDVENVPGRGGPDPDDVSPILRAEVSRLPEKYRRPIELCYWEGLSNEEAAEQLNCPPGTIKWRLSRAREILKARLGRLVAAFAVFLFHRLPSQDAKGSVLSADGESRTIDALLRMSADDDGLPEKLVHQTGTLAAYLRDSSVVPLNRGRPRNRRRRWWNSTVLMLTLAAIFLSIPTTQVFLGLGSNLYASLFGAEPSEGSVFGLKSSKGSLGDDDTPHICPISH